MKSFIDDEHPTPGLLRNRRTAPPEVEMHMFALTITLSADGLNSIKAELTRTLPTVKSSHRCEAIARGLSFRTYAAALASMKAGKSDPVRVQGDLFSAYLLDHGFDVRPSTLYRAAARVALRTIQRAEPRLTAWGIGVGPTQRKTDGQWETIDDFNARFRHERDELISDAAVTQFLTSLALLARVTPTKTVRSAVGSRQVKHIAENYVSTFPDGEALGPVYVFNGVFIAAALHMGFKIKTHVGPLGYDDVNVSFNMLKSCIDDLDVEIRPNGARAQDRKRKAELSAQPFIELLDKPGDVSEVAQEGPDHVASGEISGHAYQVGDVLDVTFVRGRGWEVVLPEAPLAPAQFLVTDRRVKRNPIAEKAFQNEALAVATRWRSGVHARIAADWPARSTKPDRAGLAEHPLNNSVSARWWCMHCDAPADAKQITANLFHCPHCLATPMDVHSEPWWLG